MLIFRGVFFLKRLLGNKNLGMKNSPVFFYPWGFAEPLTDHCSQEYLQVAIWTRQKTKTSIARNAESSVRDFPTNPRNSGTPFPRASQTIPRVQGIRMGIWAPTIEFPLNLLRVSGDNQTVPWKKTVGFPATRTSRNVIRASFAFVAGSREAWDEFDESYFLGLKRCPKTSQLAGQSGRWPGEQ